MRAEDDDGTGCAGDRRCWRQATETRRGDWLVLRAVRCRVGRQMVERLKIGLVWRGWRIWEVMDG